MGHPASVFGEVLHWADDGDVAEGVQDEEIAVAGEDQVGSAIDGECEEFVVFGMAAGLDRGGYLDARRGSFKIRKEAFAHGYGGVAVEFVLEKRFRHLKEGGIGKKHDRRADGSFESPTRDGARAEMLTDENVGIDDDARQGRCGGMGHTCLLFSEDAGENFFGETVSLRFSRQGFATAKQCFHFEHVVRLQLLGGKGGA